MSRSGARVIIGAGLLGLLVVAGGTAMALAGRGPAASTNIEIVVRYSKFEPAQIAVPVGVPITITIRNEDPIDHEWIVGDAEVHEVHRTGTELLHPDRPTEVVVPAMETRTTVVTFSATASLAFICHLPGHEAYGMIGTITIQ